MSPLISVLAGSFIAFALVQPGHAAITLINDEAKLADASLVPGAASGSAVSISGVIAVVGAPAESGNQGAVYVYSKATGAWLFKQKLSANDAAPNDRFGAAVSVAGSNIAIGAPGRGSSRGGVYTFTLNGGTGLYVQDALPLQASDGLTGDQFGHAVSVQGLVLAVGAPFDDVNDKIDVGSTYIFEKNVSWSQTFHVRVTTGQARTGDHLGWSTALHGNTVLIGAPDDDFGNRVDAGSIYVYVRNGAIWTRQTRFNPGGQAFDRAGSSVALFSNTALIGADGTDIGANANQGKAYVFTRSGTSWSLTSSLTAGNDGATGDHFGASVALSGMLAVVGAPPRSPNAAAPLGSGSGKAYVFLLPGANTPADALVPTDVMVGDNFGFSAALDSGRTLLGAPDADAGGVTDSGAAYVFGLVQSTVTSVTSAAPEPSVTGQSYAVSVNVSAETGTPVGTVEVVDGDGAVCQITLIAAAGSCALTSLSAGPKAITATYSGSLLFGASSDSSYIHTVNPANTSVTIAAAPAPSVVGQPVTFTATVGVEAPGGGTPTGTVDIRSGTTILCAVAEVSLDRTCTFAFATAGTYNLIATYTAFMPVSGVASYNNSSSTSLSHLVNQAATTTTLAASPNPSTVGQTVTLTATVTVTSPGAGPPVGSVLTSSVSFFDGTTLLGTTALGAGGVATRQVTFSVQGPHGLSAVYAGDSNYVGSTSAGVNQTVNPNTAPTAVNDAYFATVNVPLVILAPGVLQNDTNPDPGDTLTATVATVPANGTLSLSGDGGFTYTPNANFTGVDSFTYTVSDGGASSAPATVTITVRVIGIFKDGFEPLPPPAAAFAKEIPVGGVGTGTELLDLANYGDALDADAWAAVVLIDSSGAMRAAIELRRAATFEFRLALLDDAGWRYGSWTAVASDAALALHWFSLDGTSVDWLLVDDAGRLTSLLASQ